MTKRKSRSRRRRPVAGREAEGDMPPLPDTASWQPRDIVSDTLRAAFLKRCLGLEELIRLRSQIEKGMNIDSFDSGPGVEDIIRDELRQLLPSRYSVRAGVINDRYGRTCGDCDVIIFNDIWFPAIRTGATPESRRFHYPIEGVYAVCEIKQAIDFKVLDEAMEKLVTCHRLYRPPTYANRLVENRDYDACFHGLTNPLYSAIIAVFLKDHIEMDELVERFFSINRALKRLEVVRALCVLGHGTVTWGFRCETEFKPALFMRDDLFAPIFPVYHKCPKTESALYSLLTDLLLHLYNSVLGAEDVAVAYGPEAFSPLFPKTPDIALQPDPEWMEKLTYIRREDGTLVEIGSGDRESYLDSQQDGAG